MGCVTAQPAPKKGSPVDSIPSKGGLRSGHQAWRPLGVPGRAPDSSHMHAGDRRPGAAASWLAHALPAAVLRCTCLKFHMCRTWGQLGGDGPTETELVAVGGGTEGAFVAG